MIMSASEANMRKICKSKHGFTMMEIIVVVAIIVILAAVITISASQYLNAGKDMEADISSMQESVDSAKNNLNQEFVDLGY
jgi:type IV pilus assembly protein PilA